MGFHAMTAVFLLTYLCMPERSMGTISNSKSRFGGFERRNQLDRWPLTNDLVNHGKDIVFEKRRQEQFDDYGHMRFGKRGEASEDYGHMRFGKRD